MQKAGSVQTKKSKGGADPVRPCNFRKNKNKNNNK